MKPDDYIGREQTYIKHLFLKEYLYTAALIILHARDSFVYVDGFSGPWRNNDQKLSDTSFSIALETLRKVRSFHSSKKKKRIRCFFIEADRKSFSHLNEFCERQNDFDILRINGNFEDSIDDVRKFIGNDFSFSFVDPTGWTGFSLEKITPLLRLRGEVVINFMYDFLSRFVDDVRPSIRQSQDLTFGDSKWREEVNHLVERDYPREEAVAKVYERRVSRAGQYKYYTHTPILRPEKDRVHFYLAYFSNHRRGLEKFKESEKRVAKVQNEKRIEVRRRIAYDRRAEKFGIQDLFGPSLQDPANAGLDEFRARSLSRAIADAQSFLEENPETTFLDLEERMIQFPLVWSSDAKNLIDELRKAGFIETPNWESNQRRAKLHTILRYVR
jgi:three-Cys-motif partner protein